MSGFLEAWRSAPELTSVALFVAGIVYGFLQERWRTRFESRRERKRIRYQADNAIVEALGRFLHSTRLINPGLGLDAKLYATETIEANNQFWRAATECHVCALNKAMVALSRINDVSNLLLRNSRPTETQSLEASQALVDLEVLVRRLHRCCWWTRLKLWCECNRVFRSNS